MSRLRAETMPTVTVPPRPNGLPIAITQSPTRILSESPNFTAVSLWPFGSTLSTARSVLVSVPTSVALSVDAVGEIHLDLVGVGDDVVVGDDDALLGVDDEAGAQRLHLLRAAILVAATVLEELVEEILERRALGQLRHRHRARTFRALHGLRGRDVDHRAEQAFGEVGDRSRSVRGHRRRHESRNGKRADQKLPQHLR